MGEVMKVNPLDVVILIPSLNPDEKLLLLLQELFEMGFLWIFVVDDGSTPECGNVFRQAEAFGCIVEHHRENLGKGTAIKTALKAAAFRCGSRSGYITADGDGQHLAKDILHVAEALVQHPESMVLGVRDFSGPGKAVPWRSRFGNRVTSVFFRLVNGIDCPDTQTGLRGIPAGLVGLALSVEGNRYEYEMNFLMDAVRRCKVRFVEIETVYDERNQNSHFRPIADSIRIYGRFLKFAFSSLAGAAVDYLLFCLLLPFFAFSQTKTVFLATAVARTGSGIFNFLLNRYYSFGSREPAGQEAFRYMLLFLGQMLASAGLVSLLALFQVPVLLAKVIVDTVLFFISFRIQKNWVFAGGGCFGKEMS